MMDEIKVFDFQRIFFGDAPYIFLLEIVFRTFIMYGYTIFLLRLLGKRGMGQLSTLEVAIIISFGSAVGDPMMGAEIPILHGMVVITTVALLQVGLERYINTHKKAERIMEGEPDCVVDNGLVQCAELEKNNLSSEDLFRSLRCAQVRHLGEVKKAFFETSGTISVMSQPKKFVKPGLSLIPFTLLEKADIMSAGNAVSHAAYYSCSRCGFTAYKIENEFLEKCMFCAADQWVISDDNIDRM